MLERERDGNIGDVRIDRKLQARVSEQVRKRLPQRHVAEVEWHGPFRPALWHVWGAGRHEERTGLSNEGHGDTYRVHGSFRHHEPDREEHPATSDIRDTTPKRRR